MDVSPGRKGFPVGRRLSGRALALVLSASITSGLLLAVAPLGPQTAQAGASPLTEIAAFALKSLDDSSNSYQCYQNPETASCKLGGLGDLFRYLASPQQTQQIQMLEKLAQLSEQLKSVETQITLISAKITQVQFNQLNKDLKGTLILQTLQRFAGVEKDCEGKTQPYAEGSVCETWLGTDKPSKFYDSRLGKEMYAVANIPPNDILKAVQGGGAEPGLLHVLPDVISDRAAANTFFTSTDSELVRSYLNFYIGVETAYSTVYTNYWEATPHPSNMDVEATKKTFNENVRNLLGRFQSLPAGTAVDMRTGLMWTTDNTCLRNSLQPPNCGTGAGGFLLASTCPELGTNCQLPTPLVMSAGATGEKTDQAKAAVNRSISAVAQTVSDSSWKVPSKSELEGLLKGRPSGSGGTWLRTTGTINTAGEYVWGSDLRCDGGLIVENIKRYTEVQVRCGDAVRSVMNLTTSTVGTVGPKTCGGGPCGAIYMFDRVVPESEFSKYGILKR